MEKLQKYFLWKMFLVCIIVLVLMSMLALRTPTDFPAGIDIHVPKNSSLSQIANTLVEKKIIVSSLVFKATVVLLNGQKGIVAGDYLFKIPESVYTVAYRMVKGNQGLTRIKVTIPEGSTVRDIAFILLKSIPDFNAPYFIKIAENSEGYLFPDTYYFYPNNTASEIFTILKKSFDDKVGTLAIGISSSSRKVSDIVTMASIVEEEATSTVDRALISGILWKRLDEGMLLQVDPPLAYITANTTGYISIKDTKLDSLYNTYKYKGLPKGPISNPGLSSLKAALSPVSSPYYYYLSDKKGNMHYASTYEGHLRNRDKYLGK